MYDTGNYQNNSSRNVLHGRVHKFISSAAVMSLHFNKFLKTSILFILQFFYTK